MTKPFSLFKKSNGYFYVQFLLSDGSRSQNKSTGTKNRLEAEKIAMEWCVNGNIPKHINSASEKEKSHSVDKITFFNSLLTYDFNENDISKFINIMKKRGFIISAIRPKTKGCVLVEDFLTNFWTYDVSPYVKELGMEGRKITRSHTETELSRIRNYWIPKLQGKPIGSLTNEDLKEIIQDKKIQTLASKTINGIVEAITTPLKWAMKNQYIEYINLDGLKRRSIKYEEREILPLEIAEKVMSIGWDNDKAKLANKLAMHTGMRASEIRGIRLCDIQEDGVHVDHSWDRYEKKDKCCKNGEARKLPIPIPNQLKEELIFMAKMNPFCNTDKAYIFFSETQNTPMDNSGWLKYLRRALDEIGYENSKKITFHSWRHFFCSRMLDIISDKRIVMALSGHKTSAMFDHYAKHIEEEKSLEIVRKAMKELFGNSEEDSIENAINQAFSNPRIA